MSKTKTKTKRITKTKPSKPLAKRRAKAAAKSGGKAKPAKATTAKAALLANVAKPATVTQPASAGSVVPATLPPATAAKAPKVAKAPKASSLDHQRRQLLDTKTIPELKQLLKRNDQVSTGTKNKLIKRILECVTKGAFPRCPSCGIGRLKVGSAWIVSDEGEVTYHKGFKCPGGYDDDEYVFCGFIAKLGEIERPAWKFEAPGSLV